MRLVLAFVALLLSLPYIPQARPKGYELDYYRVRLESVETDGAWGGVIGNPENEQGFTTPGYRFHDPRRFHLRADACRFFPDQRERFRLRNHLGRGRLRGWSFECRRGGVSPGCEVARQTRRAGSFRGREGKLCLESLAVKNRVLQSRPQTVGIRELPADADKLTQIKILLPIETAGGRRDYSVRVFPVHWENRKVRAEFDTGQPPCAAAPCAVHVRYRRCTPSRDCIARP